MRDAWGEKVKKDSTAMNNSNILVIIDETHPLFTTIQPHYETRNAKDALASFSTYETIFDLTPFRTKQKLALLKDLARTTKAEIITDLTLAWGEMVLKDTPRINGAFSLLFYSPTNKVEYTARTESAKNHIETFLATIGKAGVYHQELKLGFHYPRVISMIVNEAYFALGESLATPEAIDLAMKFGVNYPMGPIEWGQKIGLKYIIDLLTEYSEITDDPRYRISKELKMTGKYI
jgi:3-hydroxybutyryl-CoA dehydrogenase